MKKKFITGMFFLFLSLGFITSLSAFRSGSSLLITDTDTGTGTGTGTGGEGGGMLFDKQIPRTVACESTKWYTKTYKDSKGNVVGTSIMTGGVVKSTYSGSYHSMTEVSGGVEARDGTMIDCAGWGLGCTRLTAAEACQ